MSRRVLILAYFFPPLAGGGVHRALAWTRYLPAHGWDCTVVCAGEQDYWVQDASLTARVSPATEVIRVTGGSGLSAWLAWSRRSGGPQGRRSGGTFAGLRTLADWFLLPDSYMGWARRARAAADRRLAAGGIDVLLSTSPPDSVHLAARELAARHRVPWVADFRDPWIGRWFRDPPTAWHRARHESMERSVLRGADLVLAASRTHADDLREGGHVRGPVVHLPNGFEPGIGESPDADAGDPEAFHLAFTGTLTLSPEAGTFLEAVHDVLAKQPEARQRLRVDLVGPYETGYHDRSVALGLADIVRFHGPRPHAETRALQRRADVLVMWRPEGEGLRTMVPGKLYEYMDSGRPILALWRPDEEAARFVVRAGGAVVAPGDRGSLARELETRYMAWRDSGRTPGARPDWLHEHARPALAARLAAELDRLGPA